MSVPIPHDFQLLPNLRFEDIFSLFLPLLLLLLLPLLGCVSCTDSEGAGVQLTADTPRLCGSQTGQMWNYLFRNMDFFMEIEF